jgi:hypothetical protein
MGRPLSNAFFGAEDGKIAIQFHNGTSVVTGYIVKQMGSTRYQVTVDGTTMFVVSLAQTTDEAETLVAGMATIVATLADDSEVFVKNLQNFTAWTTEGLAINWNNANNVDAATLGVVGTEPEPEPEPEVTEVMALDTIEDQETGVAFTVSGSFEGAAPTKMQYRVDAGTWTNVTGLTVEGIEFSFAITIAQAGTGVTVSVRDFSGDVIGVSATSATFDVTDPV